MISSKLAQRTTQFMLLCWGISVVSLLPIQWQRWFPIERFPIERMMTAPGWDSWIQTPQLPWPITINPIGTDRQSGALNPPLERYRVQSLVLPMSQRQTAPLQSLNSLEVSWAVVWEAQGRSSSLSSPVSDTPAMILARNDQRLAQQPELIVDLSDRKLYLYRGRRLEKSYPIAIGQSGWSTPLGVFQVMEKRRNPVWKHPITGKIIPPGPENPLGVAWIGFWKNQEYQVGFHGTPRSEEMGQAISHGCVRLRNTDIVELYNQVQQGWVVTVRP